MSRITQRLLDNGARVILAPFAHPLAGVSIAVTSGASNDRFDCLGEHHFLEHLITGASRLKNTTTFQHLMERLTSENNAQTYASCIVSYAQTEPQYVSRVIKLLSEPLLAPRLWHEHIATERSQILAEISDMLDSEEERLDLGFDATMFGNHPLGRTNLGTLETVQRLSARRLFHLFHRVIIGKQLVVVVAGSFDQAQVLKTIGATVGQVKPGKYPVSAPHPPIPTRTIVQLQRAANDKIKFWLGFRTFPFDDPDRIILSLLHNHLSDRDTSQLRLRFLEGNLGYSSPTSLLNHWPSAGQYAWYASVATEEFLTCLQVIAQELERLCTTPISRLDLQHAKQNLRRLLRAKFADPKLVVQFYARQFATLGRIISPNQYEQALGRVTPRQIQRVAQRIFVKKHSVLLAEGPLRGIHRSDVDRALRWRRHASS